MSFIALSCKEILPNVPSIQLICQQQARSTEKKCGKPVGSSSLADSRAWKKADEMLGEQEVFQSYWLEHEEQLPDGPGHHLEDHPPQRAARSKTVNLSTWSARSSFLKSSSLRLQEQKASLTVALLGSPD